MYLERLNVFCWINKAYAKYIITDQYIADIILKETVTMKILSKPYNKLILIPVMFLVVMNMAYAVNNTFFDNQTFDDADWCAASDWVIGTCNCVGFLDCNQGSGAYFSYAIPEASIDTNVTCEFKIKQNLVYSSNFVLGAFTDTNDLTYVNRASIRREIGDFMGYSVDSGGAVIGYFDFKSPFAELNARYTFYSNGSTSMIVNDTKIVHIADKPVDPAHVIYFQSQAPLSRAEDTEIDDFVCYNGTFYDVSEAPDTTPPVIQLGINNTTPKINEDINISFNVTDIDGTPAGVNVTINWSTGLTIYNYTLSADTDLHNITTITDTRGNVLNISVCGIDSSGNYGGCNHTIITIADAIGFIVIGENLTSISVNDVINISGNVTEDDSEIAFGMIAHNQS